MASSEPPNDRAPIISGYLSKLSMSGLIKHWNKRFFVLYGFKSKGSIRLEYYDDEISRKIGSGRRVIPLRDCSSCSQVTSLKSHPFVFQVTTPLGRHMLAVEDQNMLDRWVNEIRAAVKRFLQARFQAKKGGGSRQSSSSSVASTSSTASSSSSSMAKLPPGILFRDKVVTVRTDGAKKANLSGSYVLVVTNKGMVVYCPSTRSKVAAWGYKAVRTYGKSHKAFHFETGRSSEFGACRFEFEYKSPKQIFTCVDVSIKSLAAVHRDERQSAGELRQPPQKDRPVRAQSMYSPPTIPEDSTSSSESSRTTSIHLENPLQQLKALHQSFDNRPASFTDSRGKYHNNSLEGREDIFWEEDVDLTDFSDMTDFHNSPPSYQDVLKKDKTEPATAEPSKTTDSDIFGIDPFSDFGDNSSSYSTGNASSEQTPINSPTTPPLQVESSHTPFDSSPFDSTSPNQVSGHTSPFDEFGPLEMTTPPGDPWGQNDDIWTAEQVPLANPFSEAVVSTTETPSSDPWGSTEPTIESAANPWDNTEPTRQSPTANPWDNTEPTVKSPTANPWDNTEPTRQSPTANPWDNTEPTRQSPTANPWDNTEPTVESPSSSPWGNNGPAMESSTSNPWGTTELTAESPSSSPWGNTETPMHNSTAAQFSPSTQQGKTSIPQPTKLTRSDAVSEAQPPQPLLPDPWNTASTQGTGKEPSQGESSSQEQSNTEHLLQDLDVMTQSLFTEIANIQLLGSN